jgi:hypothetical protein
MPGSPAGSRAHDGESHCRAPLVALSISRSAWGRLRVRPIAARVLAVFECACNLELPGGDLLALVLPEVGDGPLNIVVDDSAGVFHALEPGMPVWVEANRLRINGLAVALDSTTIWEPCPDWDDLRDNLDSIQGRFPLLQSVALHYAPEGSLLTLLSIQSSGIPCGIQPDAVLLAAYRGADALGAGWGGDAAQLRAAAAQLAGLGGGLTPAGDDFLIGAMLWAWLAHPNPRQACRWIVEAAAPRTTTLSAAFLRAAANGECSVPWHRLLAVLGSGQEELFSLAVQQILAQGSTSGADTVAGFLWMSH